ncbi:uncharacterized protein E5676_scaffold70G00260 [Cucumis melo var. makuwa]|uniref:Reverse transcriptase domain-containing protein n=1 Tax=Cucumis melo var. makuwa TaxID=1194695 RepID=A0A5D3C5R5_CUCMM|nr:uncharacterized protein E5676_scaffold70G00260 [Cucumis melo var. makuwa]
MVTLFHDLMHKEIEVYVDDMIAKSRLEEKHVVTLRKLFERLRKFQLKLNPAKCIIGVSSGKLLGFIVSREGIKVDPDKIKAIVDLRPPKTQKEVRSFLGRLNYIAQFISHLTQTCKPILKLLRKNEICHWNEGCQKDFDKIKDYLQSLPILVPPTPGRPLILYFTVNEGSMGCVLGQHDSTGKKEQVAIKGSVIADCLAELPIEDYEPMKFDFLDEDIMALVKTSSNTWTMIFDGATNEIGHGGSNFDVPRWEVVPFNC